MIASEINDNIEWLVNKVMSKEYGKMNTIMVNTCQQVARNMF